MSKLAKPEVVAKPTKTYAMTLLHDNFEKLCNFKCQKNIFE